MGKIIKIYMNNYTINTDYEYFKVNYLPRFMHKNILIFPALLVLYINIFFLRAFDKLHSTYIYVRD